MVRIVHIFGAVLLAACFICSPAAADVVCVQRELGNLGFDPGPADGAIGKRTTSAAASFGDKAGLTLDVLTEANSAQWCNAITDFAQTPAAATLNPLDVTTPPAEVLSAKESSRLWTAYQRASECFDHPPYGTPRQLGLRERSATELSKKPWRSPWSAVRGAHECRANVGTLIAPKPIVKVVLNEAYGERQFDVDSAKFWFQGLTSYLRYSDDPVARAVLKQAVIDWAKAGAFGSGIRVSWGQRPVDYQMMTSIFALLNATAELAADFSEEERGIVGPWLEDLVRQIGTNTVKDRQDNKIFLRNYISLVWALTTNDRPAIQKVIDGYKLAIHDMRPDGSWPIDSQRGGMGLQYNAMAAGHNVLIALALKQSHGIDLFSYEADGRSIHNAVDHVLRSIQDPVATNEKYAISCPDGGDRFGTVQTPNMHYIDDAGYLLAYANVFPERESSKWIAAHLGLEGIMDSDPHGGAPACQYALRGGQPRLSPLVMPEAPPSLISATHDVRTSLGTGWQSQPLDSSVQAHLMSRVKDASHILDFNLQGSYVARTKGFSRFALIVLWPIKASEVAKLKDCGTAARMDDEGRPQVNIIFDIKDDRMTPRNLDCIVDAISGCPKFEAEFLGRSFADIAVGLVGTGEVAGLKSEHLKQFMQRVALGEIVIGP